MATFADKSCWVLVTQGVAPCGFQMKSLSPRKTIGTSSGNPATTGNEEEVQKLCVPARCLGTTPGFAGLPVCNRGWETLVNLNLSRTLFICFRCCILNSVVKLKLCLCKTLFPSYLCAVFLCVGMLYCSTSQRVVSAEFDPGRTGSILLSRFCHSLTHLSFMKNKSKFIINCLKHRSN